ncbi:MAG: peptidase S41 [Candidatus Marinimicrobia bacterium]|nr:peptidase S41 [Candidatus Neomarinimicrobiota bacterium]RPG04849.1 MAG: S41 family peptidase [Pelagibacteraceae bacterium TMED247]|tara:strand:+ start:7489 stop:8622 length:1134 start_codon:yes stop_codon:yes gene_type:complete
MIKIFRFLFIFILLTGLLNAKESKDIYEKLDLFGEVLEKIKKEYVDEVDQSEVIDSAINGVLQSLDPYSAYMSPDLFKNMQTDTQGKFGGLGIEIGMEAGVVKVISPIDDTPASKAGIKSGDYIIKINEVQVQGKSLMEAVKLMRGPVGSSIELTIRRKGERKALVKKITREIIVVKSVEAKILDNNIGYLRLKSFNGNSSDQLIKKIQNFEKTEKPHGYILDLRNNPGGLLTQAIKVTDFFLDDGEIVSTKGRRIIENRRFFAKKGDELEGKPLIVLINNGSASASEIVAGALKDHKRAIILGEKTYGKGSVQSIIPLSDGGGMRLTISKYYLPSGESISEIGVRPDIFVEEEGEDFSINSKSDNQLTYAINLLTT